MTENKDEKPMNENPVDSTSNESSEDMPLKEYFVKFFRNAGKDLHDIFTKVRKDAKPLYDEATGKANEAFETASDLARAARPVAVKRAKKAAENIKSAAKDIEKEFNESLAEVRAEKEQKKAEPVVESEAKTEIVAEPVAKPVKRRSTKKTEKTEPVEKKSSTKKKTTKK